MSGQTSDTPELAIEIDDTETIVRALVAPSHFDKKGRVRPAAFRPRSGESSISVMRQLIGDDLCKTKGVEIGKAAPEGYKGLLTIKASSIRATQSTVTDSRDIWHGHADLDHGFVSEANEPATQDAFLRMTERCNALKAASTYHADPEPDGQGWKGPSLKLD